MRRSNADPLALLSRRRRWEWRSVERRAVRDHESEQLARLSDLARSSAPVTRVGPVGSGSPAVAVEIEVGGHRLRGRRVCARSVVVLRDALPLTLVHAARYGRFWVLGFRAGSEPVVLLVEQLTILTAWHGPGGLATPAPEHPLDLLGA